MVPWRLDSDASERLQVWGGARGSELVGDSGQACQVRTGVK